MTSRPGFTLFPVVAALALASLTLVAQQPSWAPDTPEPGSVEAIAKFTTEPRFLSPWVAYVPDSATVPSPSKYLGHLVGAPGELSRTAQIYGYFRALAKATPRVVVETIGRSDEGRDILLVAVADEAGIAGLARYRADSARLADPRATPPDEAERMIAGSRPFYYLNAGLHSSETGSPEMVMELVYRLAVSEQPMIKAIRGNLVVLVNPVSEPDGRDRYVDWFYRYLKGKTDYDTLPPTSPPYWGRYVFHDNNRDAHQRALETTRAIHRMFFAYHPVVVHDLHESIALLQTWNGTGPWNPNLDPIVVSELFDMSFAEVRAATTFGMPGVWTWAFGEGFGHHYTESVANNHNAVGRGYETFGNASAETMARNLRDRRYAGRPVTEKEWYRPLPPPRTFTWSLRNNTNYMETGCLAILNYAANNAKEMLRAFYRKGYNSWQKGLGEKPFAFAIPEDQGDPRRVAEMVTLLGDQGIEVSRAQAEVTVAEGTFPRGTFIVRLDQPYRNYAVDLLAPQVFPATAEFQPYDDISWALPVHYGLQATRIDDDRIKAAPLERVAGPVQPAGRVAGDGPVFLLKDSGQEALLAARSRLAAHPVEIAEKAFTSGGVEYPPGSWIVGASAGAPGPSVGPAQAGLRGALEPVAREFGLAFDSASSVPDVPRHQARLPRLAVWHPWADTQAIGWIRYTLDREKVPYTYIRDEDIRAGDLEARFDVIVWGDVELDLQEQIHGLDRKYGPMPYTRTPEFPTHGLPDASDDITGGIGWGGMAALQRFVERGGVLVTLGNGSVLALEGGLVRGVGRAPGASSVWTPGVELRTKFARPDHPIAYGYRAVDSVFRQGYPVYHVGPADRSWVVLQWGTRPPREDRDPGEAAPAKADPMVLSGGAKGEEVIEGRPALLDVPVGKGRVLAYNFNPLHRELNRSDYRLLWNAILNWSALGAR